MLRELMRNLLDNLADWRCSEAKVQALHFNASFLFFCGPIKRSLTQPSSKPICRNSTLITVRCRKT